VVDLYSRYSPVLDPRFSYRAEDVRPDAGADRRDGRLASLGIRQLHHDGFRLTVNQDPMAPVEFKNCSTVRTSADLSDFLRVDINDDLIRLEASIGNAAMRMALRRSPDA
jgi:hypothetical protein